MSNMKSVVNELDADFKIILLIFVEPLMKLFFIMDLLKIFRMQEPVPKDLLSKNPEIDKYREVVHEKDVLLRNCKARIRELEQQVQDLETAKRTLQLRTNPDNVSKIVDEYETFYSKIICESEMVMEEKNRMSAKLKEMEDFCEDLVDKYGKARKVIEQYEEKHGLMKQQLSEYEESVKSLKLDLDKMKKSMCIEPKSSITQKRLLNKNECPKFMFEPLKGLDK